MQDAGVNNDGRDHAEAAGAAEDAVGGGDEAAEETGDATDNCDGDIAIDDSYIGVH